MRPDLRTQTNRAMVAKRKLTIETLTKLGRRKLAELLIAEAAGNRRLKQTLNLAIAAEAGPEVLADAAGANRELPAPGRDGRGPRRPRRQSMRKRVSCSNRGCSAASWAT